MPAAVPEKFDYVVAGGGLTGCVLASRLSQAGHSVVLIEAGPEEYSERVMSPIGAPHLHGTELEYNFMTTEQTGLHGRKVPNFGGRLLSGSSAVNYGLWTRCHSADYDAWAEHVGDERWNYKNMLKYFKRTQSHHDPKGSLEVYGFDGPITTTAGARKYPLGATVYDALSQSGLKFNSDANGGNPLGFSAYTEAWKNAKRQPAGMAYDLSKVKVLTESTVAKIDFDGKTATGVTLVDGHAFSANKEVLLTCGAMKTPQLLMLSGVGPTADLKALGITPLADLPVGRNLHDHFSGTLFWKLRHPEKGQSLGSPLFNDPKFAEGLAADWLATTTIPQPELQNAAAADGMKSDDPFVREPRAHAEMMTVYAAVSSGGSQFRLPLDGTHIATLIIMLLPTSRGALTLANNDPNSQPLIDPAYLQTETDKAAIRAGIRMTIRAMETEAGQTMVEGNRPPEGLAPLTSKSTDAEIDELVSNHGGSFFQNAGTASMGTVVDTQLKVNGVNHLRVCDASILPLPLAGHYMAPMYAIAEAASEIILGQA